MVMVKKCPNLMMRRTHVPAYRLLRSLSNKYIIFSSHYRTPCIIGTCLSPPKLKTKTSPEVIFFTKEFISGEGGGDIYLLVCYLKGRARMARVRGLNPFELVSALLSKI